MADLYEFAVSAAQHWAVAFFGVYAVAQLLCLFLDWLGEEEET